MCYGKFVDVWSVLGLVALTSSWLLFTGWQTGSHNLRVVVVTVGFAEFTALMTRFSTHIPGLTAVGGGPYGAWDMESSGNVGNPWAIAVLANPNTIPTGGISCDATNDVFGSPFPGG